MRCANMAMELETEKKKRFVTKVCIACCIHCCIYT